MTAAEFLTKVLNKPDQAAEAAVKLNGRFAASPTAQSKFTALKGNTALGLTEAR